jgi:hypothetical protein
MASSYIYFNYNDNNNLVSVSITAKFRKKGVRKSVVGPVKTHTVKFYLPSSLNEETGEVTVSAENLDRGVLFNKEYNVYGLCPIEDLSLLSPTIKEQIRNSSIMFKMNYLERKRVKREEEEKKRILVEGEKRIKEVVDILKKDFNRDYIDEQAKMNIAKGDIFTVYNGGVSLGRCYNKYEYLVFLNGKDIDKDKIPKGNGDNFNINSQKEHPILGKYLETTCCVDSGD